MEPKKMNELFTAAKPALLALPSDTLVRPRIPRERATQLTTMLRREFLPLLPRLADELTKARVAERHADFEALEANALIFYAADLAVEVPWTSEQKTRRAYLVKRAREHDDTLSGWAIPLFKGNKDLRALVTEILRGRGIRDDADDTVRWVALFRKEWAHAKGKTPVTDGSRGLRSAMLTQRMVNTRTRGGPFFDNLAQPSLADLIGASYPMRVWPDQAASSLVSFALARADLSRLGSAHTPMWMSVPISVDECRSGLSSIVRRARYEETAGHHKRRPYFWRDNYCESRQIGTALQSDARPKIR